MCPGNSSNVYIHLYEFDHDQPKKFNSISLYGMNLNLTWLDSAYIIILLYNICRSRWNRKTFNWTWLTQSAPWKCTRNAIAPPFNSLCMCISNGRNIQRKTYIGVHLEIRWWFNNKLIRTCSTWMKWLWI